MFWSTIVESIILFQANVTEESFVALFVKIKSDNFGGWLSKLSACVGKCVTTRLLQEIFFSGKMNFFYLITH